MLETLSQSTRPSRQGLRRPIKLALAAIAVLAVFAIMAAILLSRLDVKAQVEAGASAATGMQVMVGGAIQVRPFPLLHIAVTDVRIDNNGTPVASIRDARLAIRLWPLMRRQVQIGSIALQGLDLRIERDRNGRLNVERGTQDQDGADAVQLPDIALRHASVSYTNRQTGGEVHASDCDLSRGRGALAQSNDAKLFKRLSLTGSITCVQVRNDLFTGSDVRFEVDGKDGVFELKPVTMQVLGGEGSGTVHADFTGAEPAYRVHYRVARLHMDELLGSLSSARKGTGQLDFSTDLALRGVDAAAMTRSAQGEAVVTGEDLTLEMGNLDEKFSRYEASQNFNLIDVGAFLIAGPLGTAVTKGYNFASVMQATNGSTQVRSLASHWSIEQGVAHATDVAMATAKNRIALKGGLNFAAKEFDAVTVALLDAKGCALVEQKIHGPFAAPQVEQPNVLVALAGPMTRLLKSARDLVGGKCEPFYTGSVPPPQKPGE